MQRLVSARMRLASPLTNALRRGYRYSAQPVCQNEDQIWRSTTILCVRKGKEVVMMGDGQMSIGQVVAKPTTNKVRYLAKEKVICGFAGAAADGLTLMDLIDKQLTEYPGQLMRACVETAKLWRTEKRLRNLNALLILCDKDITLELSGSGEVFEADGNVMAIGSGGHFAYAAATALMDQEGMEAEQIANKAMKIAGDMCVYTNQNTKMLKLENTKAEGEQPSEPSQS